MTRKRRRNGTAKIAVPVPSQSMAIVPVSSTGAMLPPARKRRPNQARRRKVSVPMQVGDLETTFGRMNIQRNEMEVFNNAVKLTTNHRMFDYLRTLIDPSGQPARYPDSEVRSTSLAQSVQIIDAAIQTDATSNSGRFAFLVQPHLGAIDSPSNYAVALASPSAWTNIDWTSPNSYVSNYNGQDVRIDPNFSQLLAPNPGYSAWHGAVAQTPGEPFGTTPVEDNGYGLKVAYTNSGHGQWRMAPGQYAVSIFLTGTLFTGNLAITNTTKVDVVIIQEIFDASNAYLEAVISVNDKSSVFEINGPPVGGGGTVTGAVVMFSTTFTDESGLTPTPDFGAVSTYRPISLSVLATFVGPELINGGTISACLVSGGVANADFFVNQANNTTGSLQDWENLGKITEAYTGKLCDGSYTYWKPEDVADVQLSVPSALLAHEFPTIIVSGQYSPQTAPAGPTTVTGVLRLKIVRNIEFTTTQTLWPKARCVGSQAEIDAVNAILADLDSSMMNKAHTSFIKRLESGIGKGVQWLWKNRGTIADVGQKIASLL